jgi:hypothetical protein
MKSMQNRLKKFYEALNEIDEALYIYHYERAEDYNLPYGVWAEQGEGGCSSADNGKKEQTIEGVLDYYTQEEFDPLVDAIQECLNGIEGCAWSWTNTQYEDETKLIHFTWEWELT